MTSFGVYFEKIDSRFAADEILKRVQDDDIKGM
jgi:hypothetical protein